MNYAVDLHSDNFLICYKDKEGKKRRKSYYFKKNGLNEFRKILTKEDIVAVESTINSYYFYDEINPIVKQVKIINPLQFKVICESSSKCDKKDVEAILQFLELDMLPEIKVPSKEVRILRGLFSTYLLLVRDKIVAKNRIHAILKNNGVSTSKKDSFSKQGIEDIKNFEFSSDDKLQIEILLNQIEYLEKEILKIKNRILSYSFIFKEQIELLMTIPGISLFMGMAIITDISDIENFKNAKRLCSYLGIVPRTSESNKKIKHGKITKKGRKTARTFLSQMIFHFINSSEFYKDLYEEKKKARGSSKAIVAMMRRLTVIIYYMLTKKQNYYHINEKLHREKLVSWLKFINEVRSMDDSDYETWEHKIRIKYDLKYRRRKKIKESRKSA